MHMAARLRLAVGCLVAVGCPLATTLMHNTTLDAIGDSTAEPPALFARRGEPFNAALDWAGSALARDGCVSYAVVDPADGAVHERTHCHESARPAGGRGGVFDFAFARAAVATKLVAAPEKFSPRERAVFAPHGFDPLSTYASPYSRGAYWQSAGAVDHAADQLDYLVDAGKLPGDFRAVARGYRASVALATNATALDYELCCYFASEAVLRAQYFLFNTLVYYPRPVAAHGRRALNPRVDWADVERRFARGEVVVLDDVLEPWALDAAFAWTLEATASFAGVVDVTTNPKMSG